MVTVLECLLLWIHFIGDDDKPLAGWLGITLLNKHIRNAHKQSCSATLAEPVYLHGTSIDYSLVN